MIVERKTTKNVKDKAIKAARSVITTTTDSEDKTTPTRFEFGWYPGSHISRTIAMTVDCRDVGSWPNNIHKDYNELWLREFTVTVETRNEGTKQFVFQTTRGHKEQLPSKEEIIDILMNTRGYITLRGYTDIDGRKIVTAIESSIYF